MVEAFTRSQWRLTLALVATSAALAVAAGVVGIDDNMLGLSLALLAAVALVHAFAHPWRSPRRFLLLAGVSLLAFVVCTAVSATLENAGLPAGGVFFLIAILLCPAGLLVGVVGAAITSITSRRGHGHHLPPASPVAR